MGLRQDTFILSYTTLIVHYNDIYFRVEESKVFLAHVSNHASLCRLVRPRVVH